MQVTKKIVLEYVDNENVVESNVGNLQPEIVPPPILENVKKESRPPVPTDKLILSAPLTQLEEIKDSLLQSRLEKHEHAN